MAVDACELVDGSRSSISSSRFNRNACRSASSLGTTLLLSQFFCIWRASMVVLLSAFRSLVIALRALLNVHSQSQLVDGMVRQSHAILKTTGYRVRPI